MKVLVTGATGMLGSHVVRALVERGQTPVALSARGDARLLGPLRDEIKLERCDIRDDERLATLLRGVDTVIHLAALMPAVCRERPAEAVEVNVTATAGLYAAASRAGIARFVYASSKSAYGPAYRPRRKRLGDRAVRGRSVLGRELGCMT